MRALFSFRAMGWLLGLSLLAVSPLIRAGEPASPLTLLGVLPSPAMAYQPIQAVFMFSGCGGWGDEHHVQIDGAVVTFAHHVHDMCGVGLPPTEFAFELGAFPPGNYTLVYAPEGGYAQQSINFAVQSPAVFVPASSITTLAVLAAFILMLALRARRWHVP